MKATLCVMSLCGMLARADTQLFDAIRTGDGAKVQALVKAGADPNQRHETGATALMHAAAFSTVECLRILVDAGADVNAPGNNGATALMLGTGDTAKVRLLLQHEAAVNAKTKDGTTALLTAARRGNTESVRLLIGHGADPKGSADDGVELLRIAYLSNSPGLREVLLELGIAVKERAQLGRMPFSLLANPERAKEFLDRGGVVAPFPILGFAAAGGHIDAVRLLLERGVDPAKRDTGGRTALMMAAAAFPPNPEGVLFVLKLGGDIQAQDAAGRTALDWALTVGETEVASLLREAGVKPGLPPALPPKAVEAPRSPRQALDKAVAMLEPLSPLFAERSGCFSCHNNSLPAAALNIAAAHGVAVNGPAAAHAAKDALGHWKAGGDSFLLATCPNPGFLAGATKGLLALSEEGVTPNYVTDAVASCLASLQHAEGDWHPLGADIRPPLTGSPIVSTALAIRGIQSYLSPGLRDEMKSRVDRAVAYLRGASARDTQDETFKLLGLIWAGAPAAEAAAQTRRLLALQRSEGGWGQMPTMAPDAYSTGQALYALHASGRAPDTVPYAKGVKYLLRTQLEDGTWFVRSRAFGFQPYFESGFPHGKDQFISAAATSWAAMAIAYTQEKGKAAAAAHSIQ
jgi:ankyrin repeat protein